MAERAMRTDYSWTASREKYEALYDRLIAEREAALEAAKSVETAKQPEEKLEETDNA